MTPINSLSLQVEAYHGWKKELIRQISRYRNWLQDNGLFSDDVNQRIRRGMEMLLDDELTIAFVGEYSRGKTELINALFSPVTANACCLPSPGAPPCARPSCFTTAMPAATT